MQTVDRDGFIAYLDGYFLKLENGKGIIVPELDCEAAEAALMRNETVALTVNGKVVSFLEPRDGIIKEVLLATDCNRLQVKEAMTKGAEND